MSNHKRNTLGRGLLVAAGVGLLFGIGAGAGQPAPRGSGTPPASKPGAEQYLLLTDGRLIRGIVSREGENYTVRQRLGVIRYRKSLVESAFGSVEEAYRYRLERAPEDDPAERLRLARWCMSWHLDKEARMLLEQVIEISPDHGPARAMLESVHQSEATRLARGESKVDQDVLKTSGDAVVEDRAGALDSAVFRGAERRMGINSLPVIFDLPQAMAVLRAEQFKQYVHPVLQAYCAKCHNTDYNGDFQLVPVKSIRQTSAEALRSNLDATLRLIDRENPVKSELLSSTLRPHGTDGKRHPIFSGSNDRAYRILAAWVTSLRPAGGTESFAPAAERMSGAAVEAFATDRERTGREPLDEVARAAGAGDPRSRSMMANPAAAAAGGRSFRYAEGQGRVPEDARQADPEEFPLPYMLGGPRPTLPGGVAAPPSGRGRASTTGDTGRTGRPAPADPNAAVGDAGPPQTPATKPGASGRSAAAPATKKPVTIDPKILEKLLQGNANRRPGAE